MSNSSGSLKILINEIECNLFDAFKLADGSIITLHDVQYLGNDKYYYLGKFADGEEGIWNEKGKYVPYIVMHYKGRIKTENNIKQIIPYEAPKDAVVFYYEFKKIKEKND